MFIKVGKAQVDWEYTWESNNLEFITRTWYDIDEKEENVAGMSYGT